MAINWWMDKQIVISTQWNIIQQQKGINNYGNMLQHGWILETLC